MTKEEFIQQYRKKDHRETKRMGIVAVLGWLSVPLVIWLLPRLKQLEETGHFDWAASFDFYWVVGFFGFCLLIFVLGRALVRQPGGVACPNCGERLWGTSAQIAVFVGNCGYCGEKVLDDPMIKTVKAP